MDAREINNLIFELSYKFCEWNGGRSNTWLLFVLFLLLTQVASWLLLTPRLHFQLHTHQVYLSSFDTCSQLLQTSRNCNTVWIFWRHCCMKWEFMLKFHYSKHRTYTDLIFLGTLPCRTSSFKARASDVNFIQGVQRFLYQIICLIRPLVLHTDQWLNKKNKARIKQKSHLIGR